MKIIILNPPYKRKVVREGRCEQRADSYQYLMVPISLCYLASVLRKKHEIKLIDCIAEEMSLEQLEVLLEKEKPNLAVVNVATFSFDYDIKTAELCKKLGIKSAAMGVHVSVLPEYVLKNSSFDFVIRGEPELTSLELANALDKKKNLKTVLGITYRQKGKIISNKPCPFIKELDKIPFPARELFDNSKYIMPLTHEPYTLLVPSRGCPYGCIFCTAHHYYGSYQRYRSIPNIIEEVKEILYKNKIKNIGMWSDTFTLNKQFVLDFCKAVKDNNLKFDWFCNSRVDTLDEEMVKAMSSTGCKVITFGIESLNADILKNIRKRISEEQVAAAIKLCKKYKIEGQAHIIFGLPGETKETAKETIRKLLKINPDYAQFYCAIPFPGTDFYEFCNKNNYITTRNWEDYEINKAIVSYPNLSNQEIQEIMRKAYRRFYFRPTYALRKFLSFPISKWPSISKQAFDYMKGWVFSKK
jgi:anaerobic magnesium-protoporphyrin IX monomethyl ester cyclase